MSAVQEDLLSGLNQAQLDAVTHEGGPLLIVAGAGTGKTTVIARRIAWLISTGKATSKEILALTFTDKAAAEMTERAEQLLPLGYAGYEEQWISTFHSFAQRLLERHALDIGLPSGFRLLSDTDAYLLVHRNLSRFSLRYYRPRGNPTKFIRALIGHFSRAKDEGIGPDAYLEYSQSLSLDADSAVMDEHSRIKEVAEAYHVYEKLLLEHNCLDLGGLMYYALELLRIRPAIREKYQRQFRHVIVDEFQDTNRTQYELLQLLAGEGSSLAVVGDDDQSIYRFRGASVANILQFKDDYPEAKTVCLTENYRSLQNILDLSYRFIQANNPDRLEVRLAEKGEGISKKLAAFKPGDGIIEHLHFPRLADEVAGVVDKIELLKSEDPSLAWDDFCILARSNAGVEPFCLELARRAIPYQFLALKGLYAKPVILDAAAYLSLLLNHRDAVAAWRVLNSPPYRLFEADLSHLAHEARKKGEPLLETAKRHLLLKELSEEAHATIVRLLADLEKHAHASRTQPASEMLTRFFYDSGYAKQLTDDEAAQRETLGHLTQFLERMKKFEIVHPDPTLARFMEEFVIERDSGEEGTLPFDAETGPDMVRVMTAHGAKGLEFKHVFIVGMVDKRFPATDRGGEEIELPHALLKSPPSDDDKAHLQEERRLFYVAMTRAKESLRFTSADDYGGKTAKKPSKFLADLGLTQEKAAGKEQGVQTFLPTQAAPKAPMTPEMRALMPLPSYFSFTQLAAYAKCPLQYKFAHSLKLPVLGKPSLSFGRSMHGALEKFMNELAVRQSAGQGSLFGTESAPSAGLPVSKKELLAMYDASWQDEWYESDSQREEFRKAGREMLEAFYERSTQEPPTPLYLEKAFQLRLGGYTIKGKIDRIDQNPDGTVSIVDYKTGKAKDSLSADDKRQLLLYQLAAERALELKPAKLTYYYLEGGETKSFLGTPEELEAFEQDALSQIAAIGTGSFSATPGWHCDYCDFLPICDAGAAR